MKGVTSLVLLLATCVAVAVSPRVATAQEGDDNTSRIQRIEKLKADALRLGQRGKFTDAVALFEEALSLLELPDEDVLFNLVLLSEQLADCKRIILYSTGYIYLSPGDPEVPKMEGRRTRCMRRVAQPGLLSVESTPKRLEVRVNNVIVGRAPITDLPLAPGEYEVRAEAVDHHPFKQTVALDAGLETRVRVRLEKMVFQGNIEVITEPAGATVYLDNVQVGAGPWSRENLQTRRYLIRVEMDGWDRWVRYVRVERDRTIKVHAELEQTGTQVPIPPLPDND